MDINVRSHEGDKLDIEFVGERKTVLYLLKEHLLADDKVTTATVLTDHPQLGHPRLIVRTNSGKPETSLKRAASASRKAIDGLEDAFLDAIE